MSGGVLLSAKLQAVYHVFHYFGSLTSLRKAETIYRGVLFLAKLQAGCDVSGSLGSLASFYKAKSTLWEVSFSDLPRSVNLYPGDFEVEEMPMVRRRRKL